MRLDEKPIDERLRRRIADQLATRFKGGFEGAVIGPDHPEYAKRRIVWNAMVDKKPGLIVRCTRTEDVVAAVRVAREHGLSPSVRCGGHQVAGNALSDGGLTIDLSGMRKVRVRPPGWCMWMVAASSATWMPRPANMAWWSPPASCPRPASAAWRSAAESVGSRARMG